MKMVIASKHSFIIHIQIQSPETDGNCVLHITKNAIYIVSGNGNHFVGLVIYPHSEMIILLKTGDYENFDDDKVKRLISQLLFF